MECALNNQSWMSALNAVQMMMLLHVLQFDATSVFGFFTDADPQ